MAAGLSAEAQLRTLSMAGIAPLIGFLADQLGVGAALTVIALIAGVAMPLLRVHSSWGLDPLVRSVETNDKLTCK